MVVKCNQTGTTHKVEVTELSREDGEPLTKSCITKGNQLLMEKDKKSYPVTIVKIACIRYELNIKKFICSYYNHSIVTVQSTKPPKKRTRKEPDEPILEQEVVIEEEVVELDNETEVTS